MFRFKMYVSIVMVSLLSIACQYDEEIGDSSWPETVEEPVDDSATSGDIAGSDIAGSDIAGSAIAGSDHDDFEELGCGESIEPLPVPIGGENIGDEPAQPEVSEGLKIEITWSHAEQQAEQAEQEEQEEQTSQEHTQSADLDLHLLHPQGDSWGQAPWDCHFANTSPDWGAQGDDHNPVFDDVDVEGVAREVISYLNPEPTADTPYRVGISYYPTAGAELGSVLVTAHVYLYGELVESLTQELEAGQFATPFEIQWSEAGDGAVEVIDRVYDEMP